MLTSSDDDHVYDVTRMVLSVHLPDTDDDDCPDQAHWQPAEVAVSPWWWAAAGGEEFAREAGISTYHQYGDCDNDSTPEDVAFGWDSASIGAFAASAQLLKGSGTGEDTYDVRVRKTGDVTDCEWLERDALTLSIYGNLNESSGETTLLAENPLEIDEDDMACSASATASTGMQLIEFPGWGHPVAVGISGQRQHLYSTLSSVTVTDWNDTDTLEIVGQDGATISLDASNSSGSPGTGETFHLGSMQWRPGRDSGTGPYQMPTVSVTHACTASFGSERRAVDQAYAIDLDTLDEAISDATGGPGLGDIMSIATETDWPVLVARVYPIGGGPTATGETHVLHFEIQGGTVHRTLLLTQTSLGRWDLDQSGASWSLEGKVARNPGTLTLYLDAGSFTTAQGTTQLTPTEVVLSSYPEEQ